MKIREINYRFYIKILFLFIVFMFLCNVNVFAARGDDKDIGGVNDSVIVKSHFEGGYVEFIYKMRNENGDMVEKDIKYYKYMKVLDNPLSERKNGPRKIVHLWLYDHRISSYDKEIATHLANRKIPDFYINGVKSDDALQFGQYFMWPMSSTGYGNPAQNKSRTDKVVVDSSMFNEYESAENKENTRLAKEILKHNINDWGQISKPENIDLLYLLPQNTAVAGLAYETTYDGYYAIKKSPTKSEFSKFINDIKMKLGEPSYSTSTSDENMSKFFTVSRMGQVVTGYRIYSQRWLDKKGYKTADSYDQKNTAEGFENQYSMFLTYKNNGKTYHGIPRNVYSPVTDKAGEITDLANWPRVDSLKTNMTWKTIWAQGLKKNPTSNSIFISEGILNRDYKESYQNLLKDIADEITESSAPQIDAVTPDMVRTFNAASKTWDGYYETWAREVAKKNWKVTINNGEATVSSKDIPTTISGINKLATTATSSNLGYQKWYAFMKMAFYASLDYVEYSAYASEFTECVLGVSKGVGRYNTFITARLEPLQTTPVITNNTAIRNSKENTSIKVVDLYKVFNITEERKLELMNATSVDEGKNRGEKLAIAAFLEKDVGAYLTPDELAIGELTFDDDFQYGNLETNHPYILVSNLKYIHGFKDTYTAKNHDIKDFINKKTNKLPPLDNTANKSAISDIMNNDGFALYQEQYTMTESDPQMQFMMIVSDTKNYDSGSKYNYNKIRTTGRSFLDKEKGLFSNITEDLKTKEKYFEEIYIKDSDGKSSLLSNQEIRFKSIGTNRLKGIIQTGTDSGRYFEFIQVDFSTSLYHAFDKIIKRSIRTDVVADKLLNYQASYPNNNTLVPIGTNKYDTAAKTLYGNWKLRAQDFTGKYSGAENFNYSTTFVIPKNAGKVSKNNLYLSNESGEKDTVNKLSMYDFVGKKSSVMTAVDAANETKAVKFISRIATNDDGYFEQDAMNALSDYVWSGNKPFVMLKEMIDKIKAGEEILGIKIVNRDASSTKYEITENKEALVEFTKSDASEFRKDVYAFLNSYTDKPTSEFHLVLNNNKKSDVDLKNIVDSLTEQELFAIMLNLLVDDNVAYDNQDFIVFNTNTPPEDLLISNSRNGHEMNSDLVPAQTRRVIDWDGSSSQYNIITTLKKGDTTNILDFNNKVQSNYAKDITVKDYGVSPITNATTLYSKLYVGRIPEAKVAKDTTKDPELTLNDFKVMITENINTDEKDFKPTENINRATLNSLVNGLKDGANEAKLKSIFTAFQSSYTPTFLTKIYLGQNIADYNYINIKPIRYKEMKDATVINNKATNIVMDDWKTIPNGANLKNIKVKPGTIVEYEANYTLPNSNSSNSTWKYIEKYLNNYFKNNQKWYTDYSNVNGMQLNYLLVPTAKTSSGTYNLNNKYLQSNQNLLNDWSSQYFKLASGRNLFFTKVEIVDESNSVLVSKAITHNSGIQSAIIEAVPTVNADDSLQNMYIRVYMEYENDANPDIKTINSNIQLDVSNNYYNGQEVARVSGSVSSQMSHGVENTYGVSSKLRILTIPLSQYPLNSTIEQEVRITIPKAYDADNSRHDDWETIVVKVNPTPKDNEIEDIILYKGSYGNSETYGNVSRNNPNGGGKGNKQELSKNLNETYYAVVKVKRNIGTKKEEHGHLFVEVFYNSKTPSFESYHLPNSNGIFTQPNIIKDGAVALKDFDAPGEYMYYGFPLSFGQGITNLTINAQYRVGEKIGSSYIDKEDGNTVNNVWSENWGTGFNFYVSDLQAPSNMSYDEKKGSTEDVEVSMNFVAGLDADDSVYESGTRLVTLNIYQQKVDGQGAGAKVYPKEVKGGDKYLGNGVLQINFAGSFKTNITANFDKQKFTEGYYLYYADINKKPVIPNIYEDNLTDNEISDRMNVFKLIEDEKDKIICREPWTYNEWRVQFRWSNYEYSKPREYHYMQSIYDSEGRYQGSVERCGCSCGNRSGSDNGKTNWGPDGNGSLYWERHSIQIWLWSSGKGGKDTKLVDTKTGLNSSGEVRTGESFYVYFKTIHESNRDTLPNAPSGRSPFARTYATHVGPCDYLRRSPNVSNVIGPRQARINITGISYGVYKSYTPSSTEKSTSTNKTYVFKPLPTVQVPITNKNQTINYSIETYSYDGHRYDTYHPRKQLCTSASTTVKIRPSGVVAGGQEADDNIGQNTDTWVE